MNNYQPYSEVKDLNASRKQKQTNKRKNEEDEEEKSALRSPLCLHEKLFE